MRLIDPQVERQEARLDTLFSRFSTQPDSALAGLVELTESDFPPIKLAANYRLGWYYSFEAVDTLQAVPYLKAVLDDPKGGDYAVITRRFYDGKRFLLRDLPAVDSLMADSSSIAIPDTLNNLHFPAPAQTWLSLPDSLQIYKGIPPLVDSLSRELKDNLPEPENEPNPELDNSEPQVPPQPRDALKEEP